MYLSLFTISLFLTLLIELPLSLLFGVRQKGLLIALLVNVLTNPVAVCAYLLVVRYLPAPSHLPLQLVIEVLVVLTEGSIYQSFRDLHPVGQHPWLMALLLNAASYGTGLLMNYYF